MITDPLNTDIPREVHPVQLCPAGRGMSHVTGTAGRWVGPVSAMRGDSIMTLRLQMLGLDAMASASVAVSNRMRPAALQSKSWGLRLSLTLPCNDSTGVVQWGQEVTW